MATRATSLLALGALGTLGLRDGTLGVAWPSISGTLHQPLSALGTVLLVSIGGYLVACSLWGVLSRRLGHGPLLALGTSTVAASLAGIALAPSWAALLAAALGLGVGNGVVDTGINTHVALRGDVRLMGMIHACYGIGAAGGPLLVSAVLATGATWRAVYAVLVAAEVVMAAGVWLTLPAWGGPAGAPAEVTRPGGTRPVLLALTLGLFFMYTGIEVAIGAWGYPLLTIGRHLSRPGRRRLGLGVLGRPDRRPAGPRHGRRPGGPRAGAGRLGRGDRRWHAADLVEPGPPRGGRRPAGDRPRPGRHLPVARVVDPWRLGAHRASSAIGQELAAAGLGGAVVAAVAGEVVGHAGVTALGPYLAGCGVVLLALNEATTRRSRRSAPWELLRRRSRGGVDDLPGHGARERSDTRKRAVSATASTVGMSLIIGSRTAAGSCRIMSVRADGARALTRIPKRPVPWRGSW